MGDYNGRYHLRRLAGDGRTIPGNYILLDDLTKFGRNLDTVDVVLTSAVYSNMISRDHAKIVCQRDTQGSIQGYVLHDKSLNGTYVNDRRVKDSVKLKENDIIKFGHMNGAAIKAGTVAPQANAEFTFTFERATNSIEYMGCHNSGRREYSLSCNGNGTPLVKGPPRNSNAEQPSSGATPTHNAGGGIPQPQMVQRPNPQAAAPQAAPNHQMAGVGGLPFSLSQEALSLYFLHNQPSPQFSSEMVNQLLTMRQAVQQQFLQSPFLPQMSSALLNQQQHQPQGVMTSSHPTHTFTPATVHTSPAAPRGVMGGCPGNMSQASGGNSSTNQVQPSQQPLASPPMECDSSVPSPPKSKIEPAPSPKREEDNFSLPDSPPRAPAREGEHRSVTNSPAPINAQLSQQQQLASSTKEIERKKEKELSPPKKETAKTNASAAAPVPPKKSTGGSQPGTHHKRNEVSRLLNDLTEGSFMAYASRTSNLASSSRRGATMEYKKKQKKEAKQHKLLRQLSDVSSEESGGGSEREGRKRGKKGRGRLSDSEQEDSEASSRERKRRKMKTPTPKEKKVKEKAPKRSSGASTKKAERKAEPVVVSAVPVSVVTSQDAAGFEDDVSVPCAMKECVRPSDDTVNWVQCDYCDSWYHTQCIFGSATIPILSKKKFNCGCHKKAESESIKSDHKTVKKKGKKRKADDSEESSEDDN